jgi:hypothetical protein
MGNGGDWGKLIHEKNLKAKLVDCPFKYYTLIDSLSYLRVMIDMDGPPS